MMARAQPTAASRSLAYARGIAALAIGALGGCASFHASDESSRRFSSPHDVLLVQVPMVKEEAQLREQFAGELPAQSAAVRPAIEEAVRRAQIDALTSMRRAIGQRGGVVIDESELTGRAIKQLALDSPDQALSPDSARMLRSVLHADALLRFRITDYGTTPKAWRKAYIALEVVSTLAIAGLAYAYPKTRPLAGAYLVEESVEETLEGYGGFWALNKVCRPVRIEAEWISLDTGATVWKDSATGFSDIRPGRILRKVSDEEADTQRAQAVDQAAEKIATGIVGALGRPAGR